MHDVLALGEVLQVDAALVEPLPVRRARGELRLDLVVLDQAAGDGVDQEHAAGAQAALAHDPAGLDVEHPDLGGEHDEAVVRHDVPAGAQAVAVERRADERAVGEDDRGRAVPRLHEHRVVLVEVAADRVDLGLVLPRLRDHHHHGVRKRAAGEGDELDDLVERSRVGRSGGDDRQDRRQVAQQLAFELRLTGAHPVAVALHGVDLAVVGDHPERLCERPRRERVGRVARVHQGELGREPLVGEVGVERLQLEGRHHALVDHRAARQRREVQVELTLRPLAEEEREAVEGDPAHRLSALVSTRARHEELLDDRHRGARQVAELLRPDRDRAPAQDGQVVLGRDLCDGGLDPLTVVGVRRQERDADGVPAGAREVEAGDGAQERIGYLRDDAGAVARSGVGADRAAVLEVAQRLESRVDDVVPRGSAQGRDHGETAGVLLGGGVVETLLAGDHAEPGMGRRERHLSTVLTVSWMWGLECGDAFGPMLGGFRRCCAGLVCGPARPCGQMMVTGSPRRVCDVAVLS